MIILTLVSPKTPPLPLEELRMFADVFNQIRQVTLSPCPAASSRAGRARHAVRAGPRSVFLKEKRSTRAGNYKGRVQRLGIEIGQDRGYVTIIAPIDGSPAGRRP